MRLVTRTGWTYYIDFVTAPLFAAAACWLAWPLDPGDAVALAAGALICWPLVEWWMHRFVLHRHFRHDHWHHHRDPLGHEGGILPLLPDVLFVAMAAVTLPVAGASLGGAGLSGVAIGYGTYVWSHWLIHTRVWPRRGWLGGVARRHDVHHRGVEANYNVLIPLGDWVFGTLRGGVKAAVNREMGEWVDGSIESDNG
jgi:hypothetical protein